MTNKKTEKPISDRRAAKLAVYNYISEKGKVPYWTAEVLIANELIPERKGRIFTIRAILKELRAKGKIKVVRIGNEIWYVVS